MGIYIHFSYGAFAREEYSISASSKVADRFATDHLGSVRALVRNGQVIEQNDFYPYGMRHANAALISSPSNRWRFSAKEIQTTAGVGLLDFGALLYDDRTCRWTSQDPLATKYPGISPYSYCAGDPVGYVDVKGCSMTDYYTMTGRYYGTIPDGSSDRYIINQRILKKNDVSENVGSAYLNGNLLPVVSSASIQAMDKTYQMTESDNKEHGFCVGYEGAVSPIVTGSEDEISSKQWQLAKKFILDNGDYTAYDVHSHPASNDGDTAVASDVDLDNVVGNKPNVVLGYQRKPDSSSSSNTIQFGGSVTYKDVRSIVFYDKSKNSTKPLEYNQYKQLVNRINRQ